MFARIHYEDIDSTQEDAKRQVTSGHITCPTLITAHRQSAGRGSRGRKWISEQTGNFLGSFVFPVQTQGWPSPYHLALYPISLALQQSIQAFLPREARVMVKWPNDILVEDRKISGALHEIEVNADGMPFFIAGIGVNLAWAPRAADYKTTYLKQYTNQDIRPDTFADELCTHMISALEVWKAEGTSHILQTLTPYLYRYHQEITVHLNRDKSAPISGIFEGIDDQGALLLRQGDNIRLITSADIFPALTHHHNV